MILLGSDFLLAAFQLLTAAHRQLLADLLVAHTGLEPVISALRGQRVNQLHQCAACLTSRIIEATAQAPQVRRAMC